MSTEARSNFPDDRSLEIPPERFDRPPFTQQEATITRTEDGDRKPIAPVIRAEVLGYEILEELGRGGMGVIYKARQIKLNRIVALKMVLAGSHATAMDRLRFLAEAEAEAALHHPNIVHLIEAGQEDGLPYFTMEFVEGGTLAAKVAGQTLPPREAVKLVEAIARGVAHAHAHGIIHRDLKPENILLTPMGEPKISDFGLAKRLHTGAGITQTGAIMGTPGYMATEQAKGEIVGTAADIYALGAILYRLLAGRPPFQADTPLNTLAQVVRDEPVPLHRLNQKVPRDLEVICLKCLQKAPTKRYASAEALADDLQLFLEGKPISARPVGKAERLLKWMKRRPTAAALVATAHLVAVAGLITGIWFAAKIRDERDNTRTALDESDRQKQLAENMLVDMQTNFGLIAMDQNKPAAAALWFASAAAIDSVSPERRSANQIRFDLARRDAIAPIRAFDHQGEELLELKLRADGLFLITQTKSGRFTLWDIEQEKAMAFPGSGEAVTGAEWSQDGEWLALARGHRVEVWDLVRGSRLQELTLSEPVKVLAFDSKRRFLAAAGNSARVWDCEARVFVSNELQHPLPIVHLVFSPDGKNLATSCLDNIARIFQVEDSNGSPIGMFVHIVGGFLSLRPVRIAPAFAEEGRVIITVSTESTISGWKLNPARLLWHQKNGENINSFGLSRDGRTAIIGGFTKVMFLDARTGEQVLQTNPHSHYTTGIDHSADGAWLITISFDRTARLSGANGMLSCAASHQDAVLQLSAAKTRNVFATAQFDGMVRIWAFGEALPRLPYQGAGEGQYATALSADGSLCLPNTAGSIARVFATEDGRAVGAPLRLAGSLRGARFLSDGKSVLLWGSQAPPNEKSNPDGQRGWFERQDWRTGKSIVGPIETPGTVMAANVSPDGEDLVLACANNDIVLCDLATGGKRKWVFFNTKKADGGGWWYVLPVTVSFHPTENHCVVGGLGSEVYHINTTTGQVLHRLDAGERSTTVLFSPDGKLILTGSTAKEVRFWDAESGQSAGPALPHPDWVFRMAFSRDGTCLATAGRDGRARVWNWRTGEMLSAMEHRDEVYDVCFSPDGRWLFTISRDNYCRLWDWRAGKTMGAPIQLPPGFSQSPTLSASFCADGRRLACSAVGLVDVGILLGAETENLPGPERVRYAELVAGQKIGENSNLANQTSAEWLEGWRRLTVAHPALMKLPPKIDQPPAAKIEPLPKEPTGIIKVPVEPVQPREFTQLELNTAIEKLGGPENDEAEKWLLELGPAAKSALRAAESAAITKRRLLLQSVRNRIEAAQVLRPRRLGLKFENTPLVEAVRAWADAGGVQTTYDGRPDAKITLDLSGETFWPGLQRICTAGNLKIQFVGEKPVLVEGNGTTGGWFADGGSVYLRSTTVTITGAADLSTTKPRMGHSFQLVANILIDPTVPVVGIGQLNIVAMKEKNGETISLTSYPQANSAFIPAYPEMYNLRIANVTLPVRPVGPLRQLEATLPIEVETHRLEKFAVAWKDLVDQKPIALKGGGNLRLVSKQVSNQLTWAVLELDTDGFWDIESQRHVFELIDGKGARRRLRIFPLPPAMNRRNFTPTQLLPLSGTPFSGLAMEIAQRSPTNRAQATLNAVTIDPNSRFVYAEVEKVATVVKFRLEDLPLP